MELPTRAVQARDPPESEECQSPAYSPCVPRKLSRPRPAQGARLVALRNAAALSQAELARLCRLSPTSHVDEGELRVGLVAGALMLPRFGCGMGAPVVLASLRAPGALRPVLALAGSAQVRGPCAVGGEGRTALLTVRSVDEG